MTKHNAASYATNRPNWFELDPDQQLILEQADLFARGELYPLCARMDAEEWWPQDAFAKIGAQGLFGATVPQDYGGAGLDLVASGLVTQAFSRWATRWRSPASRTTISVSTTFIATAMSSGAANICPTSAPGA